VPLEASRQTAALIPGARLVVLEGRNHLMLPGDPQRDEFIALAETFFDADLGRAERRRTDEPNLATGVGPAALRAVTEPPRRAEAGGTA